MLLPRRKVNPAFEGSVLPGIRETRQLDPATGELRFIKTQTVSDAFFAAVRARKESVHPTATWRYRGSVPMAVAQQWARECHAGIGSRAWREYASRKLDERDFSKLRGA